MPDRTRPIDQSMRVSKQIPRTFRRPVALVLSLVVALPLGTLVVLGAVGPNAPSPAQGHAEVIANGVVPLSGSQVVWRVTSAPAALPADAQSLRRALGFVLADKDAILVTDQATGDRTRLAMGEATLVRDQTDQTRSSLATTATTYYALELVSAGATSPTGSDSRLIFESDIFTEPQGDHDLDLVRDVLKPGETGQLTDPGTPVLVLVTAGTVQIKTATNTAPVSLTTGEARLLSGNLSFTTSGAANAAYVAAIIGPEVPTPTPAATPAPANGTALAIVSACPVGYDPTNKSNDALQTDCAQPLQGVTVHYRTSGDDIPETTDANGRAAFSDLLPNTINLVEDVPSGYQLAKVVCSFTFPQQPDGTPAGSGTVDGSPDQGGLIGHNFLQGENLTCAFYDLTLPPATPLPTSTPTPSPTPEGSPVSS